LLDKVSAKDSAEIENTMRQEVLEISRYPEIVFVSRDVSMRQIAETRYAVQINGFLSLHGETRGQSINTEAEISGKTIRAQGEFKLKQSDFNIKKVKALGGTLKVKDEVEISFDITAEI
jgi:polyisoprenoid-binding protein YceI